jgi:hypothetical protein
MANRQQKFNDLLDGVFNRHQTKRRIAAKLGTADGRLLYYDESGTLIVGWVWATVQFADGAEKTTVAVRCRNVAADYGVPVWLVYASDGVLEVEAEDSVQAEQYGDGRMYNVPEHRWSHSIDGPDPLFLEGRNLLPLLVHPNEPTPDLNVYMRELHYRYSSTNKNWATALVDLTSYVPTNAGEHRLVIVCLNPATNASAVYAGTPVVPIVQDFNNVFFTGADIATIDTGSTIRAAAIRLYYSQTEILWSDIFMDLKTLATIAVDSTGSGSEGLFMAMRNRW